MLQQAQQTLAEQELTLGTVIADAGYDDADFHAAVEQLPATPLTNFKPDTTPRPDGFRKANFSYDADSDSYRCPAGHALRYQRSHHHRRRYAASPADCGACPHRASCAGEGRARIIIRHQQEASRQRNIARCHTEAGRQALRRRRHIVEPAFGHLKTYGGLGLINSRGGAKARVKVVLAAVAWDLIKLVQALAAVAAKTATQAATAAIAAAANAYFFLRPLFRHFPRRRSPRAPHVTWHYQLVAPGPLLR